MRFLIKFTLSKLIKLTNLLTSGKTNVIFIKKLMWLRNKWSPNLFDDPEFLSYVYRKKLGLEKKSQSINTLAIRASTTDYGFYSPIWENSYNLGLTSTDLFSTFHLYNNNRDSLPNLRNIIVFFSILAPGYSIIDTSERYRVVAYKHFFQIPYKKGANINPKFEKIILKKCRKLETPHIDSTFSGYNIKTYFGIEISPQERVRTSFRENQREPSQMDWLKSLCNLVVSDGRRLVVVIPPFRSDFRNLLPSETILFEKLFKMKSDGLHILNFYNSDLFEDSDLGDADHLNEKGAIKITYEIHRIFKERMWL